jgi:hypothetical protein
MVSDDDDQRQNGSGGRKGLKRTRNDQPDNLDVLRNKGASLSKKRRDLDNGDDSDHGETEFDGTDKDSLVNTNPKSKIETIARKKDDGGKDDVTSKSSSSSRLISNILKGVHKLKKTSSASDVRSSRPSQDPSKAPQDGASKVPKKSKAQVHEQDAPKSLLANISKRSPAEEPKLNSRPVSKPPSRIPSKPKPRPEQPKDKINAETSRRSTPIPDGPTAPNVSASAAASQPDSGQTASQKPTRSKSYKMLEAAVVKNLQELCSATKLTLPPNNTRQRIDLAGTFFQQDENQKFFETNESGEIILHARKPIFPEEFPSGMQEHDLSWWGILTKKDETKQPFPDAT